MGKQLIAIEVDALNALTAKIDNLTKKLEGATVTPRPEWLTVQEAADVLGIRPDSVARKARNGELETKGSGRSRMVRL